MTAKVSTTSQNCLIELLSNEIQNYGPDEILTCITKLEEKWCLNCQGDRLGVLINGFRQFYSEDQLDKNSGLPIECNIDSVEATHRREHHSLSEIYHRAKSLEIFDQISFDENENETKVGGRINRIIDMVTDSYKTVFYWGRSFERQNNPTVVPINSEFDQTRSNSTTLDTEGLSPFQNLLLSLLKSTYELNYRRYNDQCCKQIKTPAGHHTRAWKPVMSIHDFCYDMAQKETNGDTWKDLTHNPRNAAAATNHLTECKDMQFPDVKKNRNVWSFNNGIFVGKEELAKGGYDCRFHRYGSNDFMKDKADVISSKYFNQDFDTFDDISDWNDIPTPIFQSILDYQDFEPEVARWMYVMGGRLCFDVGDLDSWQVIPFLKGVAMSGKSTIITKVFKKFYETEDVKTLSNNVERKFGLSYIYDGFMFISPEVKGDLCLEQAEFQSLVSGEDISLARKHKEAKSIEWKTPGILAGNEIPNWKDNSGSVLRRILPWNFTKKVLEAEADPHLDQKLNKEIPAILFKCVKAYLDYSRKYSDQDIWNVIPHYFKKIQIQVAMITNSLQHFLASEKIAYGKELFCPEKIFKQKFNDHCTDNNLGRCKFNPDFYMGPFGSRQIEVRTDTKIYGGLTYLNQPIIFGLALVEESIQYSKDC